jgi:hypothetical protein
LGDLLQNKKVEVKHDMIAHSTGRVFVEYACRGRNSGITTTQADFWAFVLLTGAIIITDKDRLVELCNVAYQDGKVINGGDSNTASGFLITLDDLIRRKLNA